jgi:hypothetical protein
LVLDADQVQAMQNEGIITYEESGLRVLITLAEDPVELELKLRARGFMNDGQIQESPDEYEDLQRLSIVSDEFHGSEELVGSSQADGEVGS